MRQPPSAAAHRPKRRHLISIADLADDELHAMIRRTREYGAGEPPAAPLRGSTVGVYFRKTSTRTRTAFSVAATRLGAALVAYGPNDLQVNTGESIEDTGRVLSRMLDALVARTAEDPKDLRALADQERMSVVNAMTPDEHPTQAVTDLGTMLAMFGTLRGLRVLYLGEGNNTACALALALARCPEARLWLRTPVGYGLTAEARSAVECAAAGHHARIEERHDTQDLPGEVDVVYTTRWQTTGTSKSDPDWRRYFEPFRVTSRLMDRYPDAVFMHDLPAHRGEDVEAEVLDGPRSIAFTQAEYKLYGAMAVLEWCMTGVLG